MIKFIAYSTNINNKIRRVILVLLLLCQNISYAQDQIEKKVFASISELLTDHNTLFENHSFFDINEKDLKFNHIVDSLAYSNPFLDSIFLINELLISDSTFFPLLSRVNILDTIGFFTKYDSIILYDNSFKIIKDPIQDYLLSVYAYKFDDHHLIVSFVTNSDGFQVFFNIYFSNLDNYKSIKYIRYAYNSYSKKI